MLWPLRWQRAPKSLCLFAAALARTWTRLYWCRRKDYLTASSLSFSLLTCPTCLQSTIALSFGSHQRASRSCSPESHVQRATNTLAEYSETANMPWSFLLAFKWGRHGNQLFIPIHIHSKHLRADKSHTSQTDETPCKMYLHFYAWESYTCDARQHTSAHHAVCVIKDQNTESYVPSPRTKTRATAPEWHLNVVTGSRQG